jgi:hypothetical protein
MVDYPAIAAMVAAMTKSVWSKNGLLCAEMRQTLVQKVGSATFRFVKWRECARPFVLGEGKSRHLANRR